MITTTEIVKEMIKNSPLLEDGLAKGIISYSALARDIKPSLEKKLMKKVTRGAIVMAIKRSSQTLKQNINIIEKIVSLSSITVRSNLTELTYHNSDTIVEKHKKLFMLSERKNNALYTLSQGIRESMIVVDSNMEKDVELILSDEKLIKKIKHLSSITILLSKDTINTPGVYYSILKLFAWSQISVIDMVSTLTELTIVLNDNNVDKAFSILKNYNIQKS